MKLFGVLDLASELVLGVSKPLGFRHANDKSLSIQIVAGSRVFCCDNLTLSDDLIVLKAKHTWGVHLGNRIILGLEKWEKDIVVFRNNVLDLTLKEITNGEAQALLAEVLYDGTITFQTFKVTYDLYSRDRSAHRISIPIALRGPNGDCTTH